MLKALHMKSEPEPSFNKSDLKNKYLYVSGLYLIILWHSGGGGSGPLEHNGGNRLQTSVPQQSRRIRRILDLCLQRWKTSECTAATCTRYALLCTISRALFTGMGEEPASHRKCSHKSHAFHANVEDVG